MATFPPKTYSSKSHRKKKPTDRYTVCLWSIISMEKALEYYRKGGVTLAQAAEKFEVPLSTLHTRVQGQEVCPKKGPPTVFTEQEERDMHEFLLDAWFMRIPRTQDHFATDVKVLLDIEGRTTKFTDNKPGDWWFKRFGKLGPYDWMIFPTEQEVNNYMNEMCSIKDWASLSKQYILNNYRNLFTTADQVFFLEKCTFKPNKNWTDQVDVAIAYTGNGEITNMSVVHNAYLIRSVEQFYSNDFQFYRTFTGELNESSLDGIVADITQYAKSQMTPFPICLYLDEFLSSKFTYRTWLYCRTNSVIIQCIAPKIYFTFKDLSLGVFDQLQPKLDKLLDDRFRDDGKFCKGLNFVTLLREVIYKLNMGAKLRRTMTLMNLQPIVIKVKQNRTRRTNRNNNDPTEGNGLTNGDSMITPQEDNTVDHVQSFPSEMCVDNGRQAEKSTQTYFKSDASGNVVLSSVAQVVPFKSETV